MTDGSREVAPERVVAVFDVLGTLVDQAEGLRRRVEATTGADPEKATAVVDEWLSGVAEQESAIVGGERAFATSDQLDAEVLEQLASAGTLSPAAVPALVGASAFSPPWEDSTAGLRSLADVATVVGLSNASRRVLTGLSVHAGFRWHQLLSAEDAGTYKPAAAMYELAMASVPASGRPPLMVAAHAWDLRAARAAGMRTAYVPRPDADPPAPGEWFDIHATSLADLERRLRTEAG
ncbi:haloacid dehalogenase type II [Microbacterium paraoxydans]|uniref:haloacid dehalogenase type II n=1 Tax=Microbacterium paraoxydans TaxID=199592 RepID=UPI001CFAECDD|nr:haloacid dehalogenase type II [Microbacterium paraoxydans]